MTENFNILVNKLDRFRRRFYFYSLIRGIVITLFTMLVLYTLISVIEYMVYLPADVKKSVLSGSSIFLLFMIGRFLALPLLKMLRIIKPLDYKTATVLIQKHFSEIEDKLLNIIELYELAENQEDNKIILASIDQKIGKIKLFDFKEAVNFKNAVVLAGDFMVSLILAFSVFLVNKNIFTESAHRLAHYNVVFTKPAPVSFQLFNDNLDVKKGESLKIMAQSRGEYVPQILYINIEGNNYVMKNTGEDRFEFEMETVEK